MGVHLIWLELTRGRGERLIDSYSRVRRRKVQWATGEEWRTFRMSMIVQSSNSVAMINCRRHCRILLFTVVLVAFLAGIFPNHQGYANH